MSDVYLRTVTGRAVLSCDKTSCSERWESPVAPVTGWRPQDSLAGPALEAGWRVYVGGRTRHTYCPQHGPTVSMLQALPAVTR